jgi:hypothetical protein
MIPLRPFLIALSILAGSEASLLHAATSRGENYSAAIEHAIDRYKTALIDVPNLDTFPRSVRPNGSWRTAPASDWTSGFWPGTLWLLYESTGDDFWKTAAAQRQQAQSSQQFNTSTHDLGFMLYNSFGQGLRLTGNTAYRDLLLQATQSLMSRYSPTVGAMRSWSWGMWDDFNNFTVIVDNMLNLELPYVAADWPGGNPAWHDMATSHAELTAAEHIRSDDTTYHAVIFDQRNGNVLARVTHQGYGDETTWSRGQAWGIYGFTLAYRFTGNPFFLERARALADWFLEQTALFPIPPWDFDFFDAVNPVPFDSSAAAIVASALLELSQFVDDPDSTRYDNEAIEILDTLAQPPFLTTQSSKRTVLDFATGNWPGNYEIDTGIVYADYYFIEAINRYFARFGGGSYALWAGNQFGFPQRSAPGTGPLDDPNKDGIANIWHYLTNTSANTYAGEAHRSRMPSISINEENDTYRIHISATIVESHPDISLVLESLDSKTREWAPLEILPSRTPAEAGLQGINWTLPAVAGEAAIYRVGAAPVDPES